MKFLFDFLPILLFFIAYKFADIYVATAVAIVASLVQVGWTWWKKRKIETMHVVTLVLVVVLGGATLYLQDEMFIKWKPTIANGLFAVAFLVSQFIGKKTLVERIMGAAITLPSTLWPRLNLVWVLFFTGLALANLYVVYNFDTATWVNFKLFGMMGLTIAFVVGQAFFLGRYMKSPPESSTDREA
jgi:intracellular septation protein